jgi:hypothetical protein
MSKGQKSLKTVNKIVIVLRGLTNSEIDDVNKFILLLNERSGARIPTWARNCSVLAIVQTFTRTHLVSCYMAAEVRSRK